jgi:hypothetical protein
MKHIVLAISVLMLVGISVAGQELQDVLSETEKAEIIESILDSDLRPQVFIPAFANIKTVSSENIEFIEPTRLLKYALVVVPAREIRGAMSVQYLLFSTISFKDETAVVSLSHVIEHHPCFAPSTYRERRYTYESRRTANGWATKLIRTSALYNLMPGPVREVSRW